MQHQQIQVFLDYTYKETLIQVGVHTYSTGALAFANSPYHIATASREICASTDPTVTLTFDKRQTYSYNANYCWFRLTVDGIPIADDQGNTYYNATNGPGA